MAMPLSMTPPLPFALRLACTVVFVPIKLALEVGGRGAVD
jgi:hypothetical protein